MSFAVELESVTKRFRSFTAVDNLSLRVPTGSVYGFIGPNGSGKSTTLRMIMRILMPDSGVVRVLGTETRVAANDRIGYLPEERGLYKKMKVLDLLIYHADLKGLRNAGTAAKEWLEKLGLGDWGDKKVEALSKGMSQKVQFIATVISRPELLLLDEPFSGLDPVNMDAVRDEIVELGRRGATVIFSTHDMAVAERMCDYIFMIYRGNKVLDGTLSQIQSQYAEDSLVVRMAEASNGVDIYERLPGVSRVVNLGNSRRLELNPGADTQAVLAELLRRGSVQRFEIGRPTLHDIFVRIAGAPVAETAGSSA